MKRILVAAGLAVAALSLPATAALADGYEKRHVAKPKPKAKAKKKHHAKPKREIVREIAVDHAKAYGAGHKVVHLSKHEEYSRSYYEERDGHVVADYGMRVNAREGCYPTAPCTWGYGPRNPVAVGPGWGWWGHPGGVGYGVGGGYHGGTVVYVNPAHGWSSYSRSVSEHRSKSKSHRSWSGGHGMSGHHGMGMHGGMSGHHGMAGQHGVGVHHGGTVHMGPGMHHGAGAQVGVGVHHGPPMPPPGPHGGMHPGPRGW